MNLRCVTNLSCDDIKTSPNSALCDTTELLTRKYDYTRLCDPMGVSKTQMRKQGTNTQRNRDKQVVNTQQTAHMIKHARVQNPFNFICYAVCFLA